MNAPRLTSNFDSSGWGHLPVGFTGYFVCGGGGRDATVNMYSKMNCTGYFANFKRKKRGLVVCNTFLGSTFSSVNLYDEASLSSIMFFKKISYFCKY